MNSRGLNPQLDWQFEKKLGTMRRELGKRYYERVGINVWAHSLRSSTRTRRITVKKYGLGPFELPGSETSQVYHPKTSSETAHTLIPTRSSIPYDGVLRNF